MKFRKKTLLKIVTGLAGLGVAVFLLLSLPQPFFSASVSARNLTLYSDQPFAQAAGQQVLELAEANLAQSPLYSPAQKHLIFICNAHWRQRLFFTYVYGVGGVNYYPLTTNIFLRNSLIEENCLLGPSGKPAEGRTLDYFVAHEITHSLTGQALGALAYHRLPQWKREGYADYVGRGTALFDYDEAKRMFLANERKMDYAQSGLYLRFNLLVAHLLDKQHWSVQRLLQEPIEQTAVEAMIRAEKTDNRQPTTDNR